MSETIKELVYRGCFKHGGRARYNPLCDDCRMAAQASIVELMIQQERRIAELEQTLHKEITEAKRGTIQGSRPHAVVLDEMDTEYNQYSVRGELGTLADLVSPRADPTSIIKSGPDATPAAGDRGTGEREDSVGRRRRRQIFDGSGILHEEGGNQ